MHFKVKSRENASRQLNCFRIEITTENGVSLIFLRSPQGLSTGTFKFVLSPHMYYNKFFFGQATSARTDFNLFINMLLIKRLVIKKSHVFFSCYYNVWLFWLVHLRPQRSSYFFFAFSADRFYIQFGSIKLDITFTSIKRGTTADRIT